MPILTSSVDIEFEVRCSRHSCLLSIVMPEDHHVQTVFVRPCPECLREEREAGHNNANSAAEHGL